MEEKVYSTPFLLPDGRYVRLETTEEIMPLNTTLPWRLLDVKFEGREGDPK